MNRFGAIADERVAVADLLDSLSDEQSLTPSCCGEWTIEDVAAHLTVVWNYSALDYLKRAMHNRPTWFKPQASLVAINAATVAERKALGHSALAADIRAHADDRTTPTGFDWRAPLTDIVVHRRDIEVPLGIETNEHPEHARAALDTATSRRFALFNNRRDLSGLSFRATDLDWASGSGPELVGPARTLAHAMWGRTTSLDGLSGAGVDVLRQRLAASGT